MGMFDSVRFGDYWYQTKDLDNVMEEYRVMLDGSIQRRVTSCTLVPETHWTIPGATIPTFSETYIKHEVVKFDRAVLCLDLVGDFFCTHHNLKHKHASSLSGDYSVWIVHNKVACVLPAEPYVDIFKPNVYTTFLYENTTRPRNLSLSNQLVVRDFRKFNYKSIDWQAMIKLSKPYVDE